MRIDDTGARGIIPVNPLSFTSKGKILYLIWIILRIIFY